MNDQCPSQGELTPRGFVTRIAEGFERVQRRPAGEQSKAGKGGLLHTGIRITGVLQQ
jgi:hypothetical protein